MKKENRNTEALVAASNATTNYTKDDFRKSTKELTRKYNPNPVPGEKTPSPLYEETIKNKFTIKNQVYCVVPFSLIEFDESYQRNKSCDPASITSLANNWDDNLYDPILLSEHPETGTFAGIDCYHRVAAMKLRGENCALAKIATGLSSNPEERSLEEANIFIKQGIEGEKLTLGQKHKAYVKIGVSKYVILEECIEGRKLIIDGKEFRNKPQEEKDLYADWKVLTGYTAALTTAGLTNGKELLNSVLDVIESSGWRNGGYKALVIRTISTILNLHDNNEYVKKAMIDYFLPMEPEEFFAIAYERYPKRKEQERLYILLEQEVSKRIGFPPMYEGGKFSGGIATQRAIREARAKREAEKAEREATEKNA